MLSNRSDLVMLESHKWSDPYRSKVTIRSDSVASHLPTWISLFSSSTCESTSEIRFGLKSIVKHRFSTKGVGYGEYHKRFSADGTRRPGR
jgi:hypothetical protein